MRSSPPFFSVVEQVRLFPVLPRIVPPGSHVKTTHFFFFFFFRCGGFKSPSPRRGVSGLQQNLCASSLVLRLTHQKAAGKRFPTPP